MPEETKHGMQCPEFDAMLMDAIDRVLSSAQQARFEAHARMCPTCGLIFAEVDAGRLWLKSIEEVEPPVHLVQNILASTTGISSARLALGGEPSQTPLSERMREWFDVWIRPGFTAVRQPRFALSFGMIFFSFSVGLSASGLKAKDLAQISLRPSAVKHTYYSTQAKVVKYYENIRLVYEVESRVNQVKRVITPAEPAPAEKQQNRNNDTSGKPEQRQERNSSRDVNQPVLASLPSPSVTMATLSWRLV